MLQTEDFIVKKNAPGRILVVEKLLDPGLGRGLIGPQDSDFLFDGFNLP